MLLTEPISPEVRGPVVEVLATLDLTQVTQNPDGTVRLQIDYVYDDGLSTRQAVVLRADGTLQSREMTLLEEDPELGLPIGTVPASATYSRWTEVEAIEPSTPPLEPNPPDR